MKIRFKWVLSALGALLAGAVVTGYAVLTSLNLDDLRGVIEAQAKEATGRDLTISGPIDLKISLSPAITIEKVVFGNASWGAWPELFSVRRLEVEVGLLPLLSGDIEVRRLVALEPVFLLENNAEGQGNWVLESAGATSDAAPDSTAEAETENVKLDSIPAFHRIDLRGGRVIYRDGQSGRETLIQIDRLEAWADTPASPSTVNLKGSYNDTGFVAAGTFGSRAELLAGGGFPLDLKLEFGETTVRLAGAIGELAAFRALDLRVDMRGERLSGIGALIGEELPPLGPYSVSGRLSDTEDGIEIAELALKLGDSDLAGKLAIAFAGPRPAITATLGAGALDLKDFLGSDAEATAATSAGTTEAENEPARVFSEKPLGLEALLSFDAGIKLRADQAKFDDKTMASDLSLSFDLKNGKLALREVKGGLYGGSLSGELTLDTGAPNAPLKLDLRLSGFDYGHFLQGRDITDGVDGKLDAEAALRAAGPSLHAWAESLNGRVDLVGGEGRVRSDLLSASGAGLIDMLSAWREGEDDLKLNCVVMRLPVENGIMTAEAVLVDTAAVTVGASGDVDLGKETLNLKVTPQAKHASFLSLAVPLRVSGTLSEPSVGPDPLGTVIGAAKIAGMFINPLVAGAAIILESELSDGNPCVAAIEDGSQKKQTSKGPAAPKKAGEAEGLGKGIPSGVFRE